MHAYAQADIRSGSERTKGLLIDIAAYAAAFCAGAVPFQRIDDILLATAVFTAVATVVLFIVSVLVRDVSVYDPYWSVAPFVMLLADMIKYGLWNANAILLLALLGVWGFRLTANWFVTYKGLGHEDWRYAVYRKKYPPLVFQLISFFGLQLMPTVVVYAGLVGAVLSIRQEVFSPLSILGLAVSLAAVSLEFVSDRAIHQFLREHGEEHRTCDRSVWKYSRHPNYLGEMSFWAGLYLYFLACCPEKWYMGLGFLLIELLFLFVSIPMMEKHNAARRGDYAEYKARTSMLLPLPNRRGNGGAHDLRR